MTSSWRNLPSTPSLEQLAAVNELLQSIGQAPVSTLDTSNPDVSIAWNTLVSTSRNVQAEGWTFNTEYHVQATRSSSPETQDMILVSVNELQVDLVRNAANMYHDAVLRENSKGQRFLYDREQHSSTWDYDPYVDKIYYFDFEVIPIPIFDFIVARAAKTFSSRVTGDNGQFQKLQEREDYCRNLAMEYETKQGDYSYFGMEQHNTGYIPFIPAKALRRY